MAKAGYVKDDKTGRPIYAISHTKAVYDSDGKLLEDRLNSKVNTVSGKGLSTNDYTTEEKEKLASINKTDTVVATNDVPTSNAVKNFVEGKGYVTVSDEDEYEELEGGIGDSVIVDSEFSATSENPVQNKVITNALNGTITSTPNLANGTQYAGTDISKGLTLLERVGTNNNHPSIMGKTPDDVWIGETLEIGTDTDNVDASELIINGNVRFSDYAAYGITCLRDLSMYDWGCVWTGSNSSYTAANNYSSSFTGKLGGTTKQTKVYEVTGDTVTVAWKSDGSNHNYYGFYVSVEPITQLNGGGGDGADLFPSNGYSDMNAVTADVADMISELYSRSRGYGNRFAGMSEAVDILEEDIFKQLAVTIAAANGAALVVDLSATIATGTYTNYTSPYTDKSGNAIPVVIYAPNCTSIAYRSCNDTGHILTVIAPKLQSIANQAFWGSHGLKMMYIPSTCMSLGGTYTFSYCENLESIFIDRPSGSISGNPWWSTDCPAKVYWLS